MGAVSSERSFVPLRDSGRLAVPFFWLLGLYLDGYPLGWYISSSDVGADACIALKYTLLVIRFFNALLCLFLAGGVVQQTSQQKSLV
jgi:hypothetical protein